MATHEPAAKNLDREKVDLLVSLRKCLGKERECLLDINVSNLWIVVEEKRTILEAIQELIQLQDPGGSAAPSPLRSEIDRLKMEIRERARENREFIQSSLAVFDELIARLVDPDQGNDTYRPSGSGRRTRRNPIYRRKV